MELNKENENEFPNAVETEDGTKWLFPKCVKCVYSDGKFCRFFKDDKVDLTVDLFECPKFEEKK